MKYRNTARFSCCNRVKTSFARDNFSSNVFEPKITKSPSKNSIAVKIFSKNNFYSSPPSNLRTYSKAATVRLNRRKNSSTPSQRRSPECPWNGTICSDLRRTAVPKASRALDYRAHGRFLPWSSLRIKSKNYSASAVNYQRRR